MARLLYGNTPADFTLSRSGKIVPNAPLTVWTAVVGGSQVTDLLDYGNVPVATVTSDDAGLVRFYAPDGTDATLWIQADSGGTRLAVRPVNLPTAALNIGTVDTGTAAATLTPDGTDAWTLDLTLPSAGEDGVNTAAIQDHAVTVDKIAPDAANNGLVLTSDDGEDSGMKWSAYGVADLDIGTVGTGTPAAASMTGNPEDGYELNLTLPPVGDWSISDVAVAADADIDPSKIAGTALTTASTGVFSVLDYGAVGDGTADDTVAIQAAIDAAAVSGGVVYLPAGDYKISAALQIEGFVSMKGATVGSYNPHVTHGTRIIPVTPGQTAVLLDAVNGISNVTFSDFSINGVATADACIGIEMRGEAIVDPRISGIEFRQLYFSKLDTGIWSNNLPVTPPAPSQWQNDGIQVVSCGMDEVNVGIHLTSQNNDLWHINGCGIGFFDYGIWLERSGFVMISATSGGAVGGNAGSSFILAGGINGPLTVVSSQAEQVDHFYRLADDAPGSYAPMTFIGCVADAPFTFPAAPNSKAHKLVLISCMTTLGTSVDDEDGSPLTTIIGLGNSDVPFNAGSANVIDLDQSKNLLTANQASSETDVSEWLGYNASTSRSTAQALVGAASLLAEITTSPGTVYQNPGVAAIPVVGGLTFTFVVSVLAATNTPTVNVGIEWYDVAGDLVTNDVEAGVVSSAAWQELVITRVAPAEAVYAGPRFTMTGTVGDSVYADCFGFWDGNYRPWRMPGYTVEGSRGGNAALASLLTQLEARGLITDSTS